MLTAVDDDTPVVLEDIPPDGPMLDAVVKLGDRCRATLGFLPRAVFADKAATHSIIGAVAESRLVGYICFELTRRYVRLIHLCVNPGWRGRGIARRLVDHLRERYSHYPGILVRCRHDYGLAPMWIKLGFRQRAEVTGRSHDGHVLTVWWLDHGHPTLFTELTVEPLLRATVDLCIVRDLSSDAGRPDAADTKTLLADHVSDRLQLLSTRILLEEISSLEDGSKRGACVRLVEGLAPADESVADIGDIERRLVQAARRVQSQYPIQESDKFDVIVGMLPQRSLRVSMSL